LAGQRVGGVDARHLRQREIGGGLEAGNSHNLACLTADARFLGLDEWPEAIPAGYHEVLEDLRQYDGKLILK
jgi:hypothetical protein